MQSGAYPWAEPVARGEQIQIDRELAHRREEYQTPDRRAPRRRECGRVGPQRVGDNRAGRAVCRDDGCDRFRALNGGGASRCECARIGLVMAGQVESDDTMSGLDEGFDEHAEVWATSAPAVHKIDRRPVAPGLANNPVPAPVRFQRLAGWDSGRHTQTGLKDRWG